MGQAKTKKTEAESQEVTLEEGRDVVSRMSIKNRSRLTAELLEAEGAPPGYVSEAAIDERIRDIDEGRVKTIPFEQGFAEIRAKLDART